MKKRSKKDMVKLGEELDVAQIRVLSDWGLSVEKISYVMKQPVSVISRIMDKYDIIESL